MGTGENHLEGLTIDKANYVIFIDKETFDTNKMDMNFDLKMSVEGQKSTIQTKSVVTFTEINHLDTIDALKAVLIMLQLLKIKPMRKPVVDFPSSIGFNYWRILYH